LIDLFKAAIALGLLIAVVALLLGGVGAGESLPAAGSLPGIAPVVATVVARPDGSVTIGGRGRPGTTLEILGVAGSLATTTVSGDGTWSLVVAPPSGEEELAIRVTGGGQQAEAPVVVVPLSVPVPASGQPLDAAVAPSATATAKAGTSRPPCGAGACPDPSPVQAPASGSTAAAPVGTQVVAPRSATVTVGQTTECRAPAGFEHTFQRGDTLSRLAARFLGSPSAVSCILDATHAKALEDSSFYNIANPHMVPVGARLWIPLSPDDCGCRE
jgi:nucleoid-associated protein YgaU